MIKQCSLRFPYSSKVSAMDKHIFSLELSSLILASFWCIMMFSIWIWTACMSVVSAYQSTGWNEILTLTLLIGIYVIDLTRASLDTLSWSTGKIILSSEYKSPAVTYISFIFLFFLKTKSEVIFKTVSIKWIHRIRDFFRLEGTFSSLWSSLLHIAGPILAVNQVSWSFIWLSLLNLQDRDCMLSSEWFFPLYIQLEPPISIYDPCLSLPLCINHKIKK